MKVLEEEVSFREQLDSILGWVNIANSLLKYVLISRCLTADSSGG